MTTVQSMKANCETLLDVFVHDSTGLEEYRTTIPTGTKGTILGLSSSDNYVVYFGNEYDEAMLMHNDNVRNLTNAL